MAERFYASHSSRRIARPVMKVCGTSLSTLSTGFGQAYSAAALAGTGGLPISGRTRWKLASAVAHESRDEPSCRGLRPLRSPRRRAVDAGSRRHETQEPRMAETVTELAERVNEGRVCDRDLPGPQFGAIPPRPVLALTRRTSCKQRRSAESMCAR